jgi:hypothetical protein
MAAPLPAWAFLYGHCNALASVFQKPGLVGVVRSWAWDGRAESQLAGFPWVIQVPTPHPVLVSPVAHEGTELDFILNCRVQGE